MRRIRSPIKQKVLLTLGAGILLSFSSSPKNYFKILRAVAKEWRFIERRYLYQLIREFREDRLVEYHEKDNDEIEIVLTEQGKKMLLRFDLDNMQIQKPLVWDRQWRVVLFDIPEKKRRTRDALRDKLKELGFRELQKSAFIIPHPCTNEINFLIEFFEIRNYVRLAEVSKITNEAELLLRFKINKNLKT